jgi:hypothetical protein
VRDARDINGRIKDCEIDGEYTKVSCSILFEEISKGIGLLISYLEESK